MGLLFLCSVFWEGEMAERPVAHFAEDGRVHGLEEHLRGTAELTLL